LGFFLLVSGAGLGLFLAGLLLVVLRGAVAHVIDGFGGWLYPQDGSFPTGFRSLRSPGLRVTLHSAQVMYSDEKVGPEFSDRSAFRFLGVMSDFHWAFPEFGRQSLFLTMQSPACGV
jgi:hypothetical protein